MAKLDELIVELQADIGGLRSQLAVADKTVKNSADNTVTQSRRMATAFRAVGTAVAALGVARLGKGIIGTTALFQQLEARLITATGTIEGAGLAFSQLTDFASTTPFQLQGVVSAFIELRQQGIQPTFEQFRAMGDAAAATGNDITRFSGAVVGAIVGETERLKAFGIQSRIEGDKISFTFNGITRTVNRSADEIVAALTEISQQNFAGGMERQAATLGGAFSNLQDSTTVLANTIGEIFAPSIAAATRELTDNVNVTNSLIKEQGLLTAATYAATEAWLSLGETLDVTGAFDVVANRIRSMRDNLLGISQAAPQAAAAVQESSEQMANTTIGGMAMGGTDKVEEDPAVTRQMRINEIIAEMDEKAKEDELRREAEQQRRLTQFKEAGASDRIKTAANEIRDVIGSAASGNKALFQINKAAALAQAALDARESVVAAYKFGARVGGPVTAAAFAGVAAAAQAANIAQIANTSFGGGGSAPTVGTAPVNDFGQRTDIGGPAGQSGQTVNLTITGSDKLTRAIAQSINTAVEDGVNLRVN